MRISIEAGATRFSVISLGFGLWLACHPYFGIWHDARIYTLMALHWLDPAPFGRDPWLMFGSQSDYSIFAPIYGSMIRLLGIEAGAIWITAIGGLSFVVAAYVFSQTLPLGRFRTLVFLALVAMHIPYCPNNPEILVLQESFVTARPLAIAFSLLGIAACLASLRHLAWAAFGVAIMIHPLMGIWAIVVSLFVFLEDYKVLAALATAGLAVMVGALAGWTPLQAMSLDWAMLVQQTSVVIFMPFGDSYSPSQFIVGLSLLLFGAANGEIKLRRWYLMAALVGSLGWFVSVAASMIYPATLIMQLQLWRAMWLAMLLAVVATCDLILRSRQESEIYRLALLAGAIAWLNQDTWGGYGLLAGYLVTNRRTDRLAAWLCLHAVMVRRVLLFLLGVSLFAFLAHLSLDMQIAAIGLWEQSLPASHFLAKGFLLTAGNGLLPLVAWIVLESLPLLARVGVAMLVLFFAGMGWDHRPDLMRLFESRYSLDRSRGMFSQQIRAGETVYWPHAPERVWYELGTASYTSSTQAIGIIFSERHAMELERRLARVATSGLEEELIDGPLSHQTLLHYSLARQGNFLWQKNLHRYEGRSLSRRGIGYLCEDAELDWIIHNEVHPGLVTATYLERRRRSEIQYGLYDCRKLRRSKRD